MEVPPGHLEQQHAAARAGMKLPGAIEQNGLLF
jgi:hypothetical protein